MTDTEFRIVNSGLSIVIFFCGFFLARNLYRR